MVKKIIRYIYLYIFSTVGLVLVVIGMVRIVDLGLKAFIFKRADNFVRWPEYPLTKPSPVSIETEAKKDKELTAEEKKEFEKKEVEEKAEYEKKQVEAQKEQKVYDRERTAASSLAMIIIGTPLFLYHWRVIQKEREA